MLESIEMPCSWQITNLTIMPSEHMNVVSSAPSQGSFNKNILQFLNPYLGVLGGPVGGADFRVNFRKLENSLFSSLATSAIGCLINRH